MPDTDREGEAAGDWLPASEGAARRRRSVPFLVIGALAPLALGLGLGIAFAGTGGAVAGPEGVPLQHVPELASPNTTASGIPVDGSPAGRAWTPPTSTTSTPTSPSS